MQNQNPTTVACDPNYLLNQLTSVMHLDNDLALARKLNLAPRTLAMLREGRLQVSTSMLLWMHQASGIGIPALRSMLKHPHRARQQTGGTASEA